MNLPIGPTLANVFPCFYVKKWPGQLQVEFRPVYQGRYVDEHYLINSIIIYINIILIIFFHLTI